MGPLVAALQPTDNVFFRVQMFPTAPLHGHRAIGCDLPGRHRRTSDPGSSSFLNPPWTLAASSSGMGAHIRIRVLPFGAGAQNRGGENISGLRCSQTTLPSQSTSWTTWDERACNGWASGGRFFGPPLRREGCRCPTCMNTRHPGAGFHRWQMRPSMSINKDWLPPEGVTSV